MKYFFFCFVVELLRLLRHWCWTRKEIPAKTPSTSREVFIIWWSHFGRVNFLQASIPIKLSLTFSRKAFFFFFADQFLIVDGDNFKRHPWEELKVSIFKCFTIFHNLNMLSLLVDFTLCCKFDAYTRHCRWRHTWAVLCGKLTLVVLIWLDSSSFESPGF